MSAVLGAAATCVLAVGIYQLPAGGSFRPNGLTLVFCFIVLLSVIMTIRRDRGQRAQGSSSVIGGVVSGRALLLRILPVCVFLFVLSPLFAPADRFFYGLTWLIAACAGLWMA